MLPHTTRVEVSRHHPVHVTVKLAK
ncbi:MAG: hypothetical protein RL148_50, partial [Planctomycetota bacterium]